MPEYRTRLGVSCVNFRRLLRVQRRPQDALEWLAKAIPLLEPNLARDANLTTERLFLRKHALEPGAGFDRPQAPNAGTTRRH